MTWCMIMYDNVWTVTFVNRILADQHFRLQFSLHLMHQSFPPALPPFHLLPQGTGIFWALDGKFPWGGDFWAVKSPGVGTKKENKCPVPRQLCNIFIDRTVDVRFFVLINVFLCNGARILTILTTNRRHAPVYGFSTDIKLLTLKLIERCNVICYE